VALLDSIAVARGVTLAVDVAGAVGRVNLPEDSLRQVLYNIIVNAIEASSPGSAVQIKATLSKDNIEIVVADRGEGIAPAIQSQIYEPFFTTKSQSGTGGLGLGLPISKGLIEAMQGSLDLERTSRSGTIFRVTIPVCQPDSEVGHE
jgi:signal transduction histidine kinase